MKKILMLSFVISAACALITLPVMASPFPDNVANDVYGVIQGGMVNGIPTAKDDNDNGPDINDAVNRLQGTALGRNKDVDPQFIDWDSVWKTTNQTVSVVFIGSSASFSNTIGAYTDIGTGSVQTPPILGPVTGFGFAGDGTQGSPYPAAQGDLNIGTQLGWRLNVSGPSVWDYFSEPGLNHTGFDHMMTFDLPGADGTTIWVDMGMGSGPEILALNDPYLITWEDLEVFPGTPPTLGDDDYDDMMFLVDNVVPIPVPPTMLLLASGLIGLVGLRRKLKK
jgi:hypothetical protein